MLSMSPLFQSILLVSLYLYAGHLTWWRMLVTDPQGSKCRINNAVANGTLPFIVYAVFVAAWAPLMVLGYTASKLS